MKACAYYKIIPELHLVIEYFGGGVTIEDILNTKREEIKANYDPTFNFIVDFRDAKNIFSEKELMDYIEFVMLNKGFVGSRRSAIISNSALSLVTTSIYAMYGRTSLPMDITIVKNLSEALEWVEIDKSHSKLIQKLFSEYQGICFD